MNIDALDHLVLTVRDIGETVDFYTRVLGMEAVTFGEGRTALNFGLQKVNLHQLGQEFKPNAAHAAAGAADLCFLTSTPLHEVIAHVQACGVDIEEGLPEGVPRTGAQYALRSVYLRDPDGNLIEISNKA